MNENKGHCYHALSSISRLPSKQHQDGVWVQSGKEQQVDRFPHFSDIMHHVQCDGGRKRPVGQTVRHGDGSGGKQRKKQSKSAFLLQRGYTCTDFSNLNSLFKCKSLPHMTSEKSSSVFLLLFIKRDIPEVTQHSTPQVMIKSNACCSTITDLAEAARCRKAFTLPEMRKKKKC